VPQSTYNFVCRRTCLKCTLPTSDISTTSAKPSRARFVSCSLKSASSEMSGGPCNSVSLHPLVKFCVDLFLSEIAELMSVKSKHGAGGEYAPEWRPKVRRHVFAPVKKKPNKSLCVVHE
jgi:hypothetical protein